MSDKIYNVSNIKSCPKCGSGMFDGPSEISWYPDPPGWRISCGDCLYSVDDYSEEDVIIQWNKELIGNINVRDPLENGLSCYECDEILS